MNNASHKDFLPTLVYGLNSIKNLSKDLAAEFDVKEFIILRSKHGITIPPLYIQEHVIKFIQKRQKENYKGKSFLQYVKIWYYRFYYWFVEEQYWLYVAYVILCLIIFSLLEKVSCSIHANM